MIDSTHMRCQVMQCDQETRQGQGLRLGFEAGPHSRLLVSELGISTSEPLSIFNQLATPNSTSYDSILAKSNSSRRSLLISLRYQGAHIASRNSSFMPASHSVSSESIIVTEYPPQRLFPVLLIGDSSSLPHAKFLQIFQ